MDSNKLKIQTISDKKPLIPTDKLSRRHQMEAVMERLWKNDPKQFDPERDAIGKMRVLKTIDAIKSAVPLNQKKAVDLGCGSGVISRKLHSLGVLVDAVDVSTLALEQLKSTPYLGVTPIKDCLPNTQLNDNAYDLVVCTEVITLLNKNDYRYLMSELARLVNPEGIVACSTALDIHTDDPLQAFATLAETEFNIECWILSYHRLLIKLCNLLRIPKNLSDASHNPHLREKEMSQGSFLRRFLYQWNTTKLAGFGWSVLAIFINPIANLAEQSQFLAKVLEKMTKFLWADSGISHALFIGKRRPLTAPLKADVVPREMQHKRQVWE